MQKGIFSIIVRHDILNSYRGGVFMHKTLLSLVLGTSLTSLSWAQWEHFPVWFPATANDCEINNSGTAIWATLTEGIPMKGLFSDHSVKIFPPLKFGPLKTFFTHLLHNTPEALLSNRAPTRCLLVAI